MSLRCRLGLHRLSRSPGGIFYSVLTCSRCGKRYWQGVDGWIEPFKEDKK